MLVAAGSCPNYEIETVRSALQETLRPLGGLERFLRPGQRVLIKPNLVMGKRPEECATTHPALVQAVAEQVRALGAEAIIAESPGGPYNRQILSAIYGICGMKTASQNSGVPLNYDTAAQEVSHPAGRVVKRLTVIQSALEADVILNLCKLKTHGMTMYTGAVKNLFGVIPGTHKAEYHFRMPDAADFCGMLVDICTFLRPTLSIMDAVVGMEGDGPSGGTPREVGLLLASANPYALDLVASDLIGYAPGEVLTVQDAIARGLCPASAAEVPVAGVDLAPYRCDFVKPKSHGTDFLSRWPKWLSRIAKRAVRPHPVIRREVCVGCGECARLCPAKTIHMKDGKPDIALSGCIRCFCCQELCPKKAVDIHRPWLMRLANQL